MARGHGWMRGIREKIEGNLDQLHRSLRYIEARKRARSVLFKFSADPRFREIQEVIEVEIEQAKVYLADMDFDDDGDVKAARVLTANIRALRSIVNKDALKVELKVLAEDERGLREAIKKIEERLSVRSA